MCSVIDINLPFVAIILLREVRLHSDLRLIVVGALPLLTTYCPYRAPRFQNLRRSALRFALVQM
jgi:hypothetical protein